MRATDVAQWAALASVVGFVVGVAAFLLTNGTSCPAVAASAGLCDGRNSLWDVVSALGLLVFLLGVPTAAGASLYARLTATP